MVRKKLSIRAQAIKNGYKSGLEESVDISLQSRGVNIKYEDPKSKIGYTQPAKSRTYTPDFVLPNGIIIETKGRFTVEDRKKHLWIKEQFPEKDIRFVFSNSRGKIRKGSNTTYGDWCEKYGFQYADKDIPADWIAETPLKNHE